MKFKEILQMKKEEIDTKLSEFKLELIKLNAQVATGTPPKNSGRLKTLKKDIARIMLLKGMNKKKAEKLAQTKSVKSPVSEPKAKVKVIRDTDAKEKITNNKKQTKKQEKTK